MGYTLRQLRLFYAWGQRLEERRLADMADAVRVAIGAEPKDFVAWVRALRADPKPRKKRNTPERAARSEMAERSARSVRR